MKSILQDENVLERFVAQMILEKGVEVQEEEKKKIIQELDSRIEDAMISALSDERLMTLNKLLDDDAPDEKIEEIFSENKKDIEVAVSVAMKKFKNEWMGR